MSSRPSLSTLKEKAEAQADSVLDDLFSSVEASFVGPPSAEELKLPPASDGSSVSAGSGKGRSPLWLLAGTMGAIAVAALALWWSFIHLPNRMGLQLAISGDEPAETLAINTPETDRSETENDPASETVALAEANDIATTEQEIKDSDLKAHEISDDDTTSDGVAADLSNEDSIADGATESTAALSPDTVAAVPAPAPVAAPAPAPAPPVVAAAPPPRPAPPPAPVVAASNTFGSAPPADSGVPEIQLVGVMGGSDGSTALLMVNNQLQSLQAGATVADGWRVASVSDRQVSLTNGSRTISLQLGLQ